MFRPGATGIRIIGIRDAEHFVGLFIESEPIILPPVLPAFELHHELDPLRRSRRRDAEQILDVDQSEPADLHVVPRQFRTGADDERLGPAVQIHDVVRHQAMAADDEVERALALADAALSDHRGRRGRGCPSARRAPCLSGPGGYRGRAESFDDRVGSGRLRPQQRNAGAVGFRERLRRRVGAAGDEQAWQWMAEDATHGGAALLGGQRLEVVNLASAEHQDTARPAGTRRSRRARGRSSVGGRW